jgi:exonuclease VII small subunit
MPPVSSPGSRNSLIAWAVVFAILWVAFFIMAIYFYATANKFSDQLATQKKSTADLVSDADLNSDAVRRLKELRTAEGSGLNSSMSVFQAAVAERDQVATLLAGPGDAENPTNAARSALQKAAAAGKQAGLTVPASDNLALALSTLADGLTQRMKEIEGLSKQLEESKQQAAAQAKQFEDQRAEMNRTVDAIRAEQAKLQQAFDNYRQGKDQSVGQIEQNMTAERQRMQDEVNAAQVQISDLQRQLKESQGQITTLQTKLGSKRINTQDPIVRNPDGRIIRIPAKDVVYINLGSAESITPGLTFEVYDKIEGIPPAGDPTTEENLPQGKASIEVVRVGAGSSECRVVRQTLGTQITEGDLIVNLVYDPNVKYNFVVYGDFDMDRNNVATAAEADVVRRLITQWGGNLMDKVNVDTDFVVLGKEPVLPTFTREELQDPFNAKKLADAQAALEAYDQVRNTARDLHIPIVNQNRFLYLIGYYDQARR